MTAYDRLLELAGRYADGAATADEVRELESALHTDPVLRQEFLRYMNVDAALVGAAATLGEADAPAPRGLRGAMKAVRPAAWWATAAAALILAVVLWHPWQRSGVSTGQPETPGVSALPPVVLVAATNACWDDPDAELSLRSGDLPAGTLRLESGVAEFRFAQGATAVLLGPAAVRFPGPNQMFLHEGKVLCRCPTPASRITLTTPATQVVDLGTEFAVEVGPGERGTRVAVVQGEVRVGTAPPQVLRTGETAQVGPDKVVRLAPLAADTFAELFKADASRIPVSGWGANLLADPSFAAGPSRSPWYRTDGHVDSVAGRDGVIAVHARGSRFWPGVRQKVATGNIDGRLVVGSVAAVMPAGDLLKDRQWAILKIMFLDEQGREFATAFRYFLQTASPGRSDSAQVATFAPPGTRGVEIQLLLNARGLPSGTVWFENPRLAVISTPAAAPAR